MDDESTCMSEGMTVTFQGGEIERIYILLGWLNFIISCMLPRNTSLLHLTFQILWVVIFS